MSNSLLEAVRRHIELHGSPAGVTQTLIPGLSVIRALRPSGLEYAISQPLICLVLQGAKQVTMGRRTGTFCAGDSLLITGNVPTVSQITRADRGRPYFSLVLDLDLAVLTGLAVEMKLGPVPQRSAVRGEPTDAEVAESALRLMQLLEHPAALPVLSEPRLREMYYWLLAGRHGPAIRQLGCADSHSQRVSRAVALLRTHFSQALPVERLAAVAGMSLSSFHEHFRAATSLSPRQFQKQLRLIEARRLMTAEGVSASGAAFAVGYESVPQFSREYRRMFGLPPRQDSESVRRSLQERQAQDAEWSLGV